MTIDFNLLFRSGRHLVFPCSARGRSEKLHPFPGHDVDSHFLRRDLRPVLARRLTLLILALAVAAPRAALCAESEKPTFEVTAQEGRFDPSRLEVPANTAFIIRVTSNETTAIEFESFELHRERVVQPGETIAVNVGALAPGTYKFFDDFHQTTPQGAIVVK
jgi:plastocyanin